MSVSVVRAGSDTLPNLIEPPNNIDITIVGKRVRIPPGAVIGRNCRIAPGTPREDVEQFEVPSGGTVSRRE